MQTLVCHGYRNGCTCPACNKRTSRHALTGIHRKEVREFITRELTPHGWQRVENDSSGHPQFWHPDAPNAEAVLKIARTPSDRNWHRNALRDARRIWPGHPRPQNHHRRRPQPVRLDTIDRPALLIEHANTMRIPLTREQASILIDREGGLPAARTWLNRARAQHVRHERRAAA